MDSVDNEPLQCCCLVANEQARFEFPTIINSNTKWTCQVKVCHRVTVTSNFILHLLHFSLIEYSTSSRDVDDLIAEALSADTPPAAPTTRAPVEQEEDISSTEEFNTVRFFFLNYLCFAGLWVN
jgi:hypothetical protein